MFSWMWNSSTLSAGDNGPMKFHNLISDMKSAGKLRFDFTKAACCGSTKMSNLRQLEQVSHDATCGSLDDDEFLYRMEQDQDPSLVPPARIRCMLNPKAIAIDSAMVFVVLCSCISAPLTFIWGGTWYEFPLVPGGRHLLCFDLVMDVAFAVHLLVRLNMTYLDPHRRWEVFTLASILQHHMCSPLYWLLVASTSTYVLIIGFGASLFWNSVKIFRLASLMSLPDSLQSLYEMRLLPIVHQSCALILAGHWLACVLINITGARPDSTDFRIDSFTVSVGGRFSLYLKGFVEAVFLLTGAMDNPLGKDTIRENSFEALMLVLVLGPVGVFIISTLVASVMREQELLNVLNNRHSKRMAFTKRALGVLGIPEDLQRRVFSLHYYQIMGHDREALNTLFNGRSLSQPLECALRAYLYLDSVLRSRWFQGKDINYIIAVIQILDDKVYLPGDYAARRGELGTQMFFIARGKLTVLVPHRHTPMCVQAAQPVSEIGPGDFFGEVALIGDCVRTAWVRADTWVLTSTLSRKDITQIWVFFPDEFEALKKSARSVCMRDRRRKAGTCWFDAGEPVEKSTTITSHQQQQQELQGQLQRHQHDVLPNLYGAGSLELEVRAPDHTSRRRRSSYRAEALAADAVARTQVNAGLHRSDSCILFPASVDERAEDLEDARATVQSLQMQVDQLVHQQLTLEATVATALKMQSAEESNACLTDAAPCACAPYMDALPTRPPASQEVPPFVPNKHRNRGSTVNAWGTRPSGLSQPTSSHRCLPALRSRHGVVTPKLAASIRVPRLGACRATADADRGD